MDEKTIKKLDAVYDDLVVALARAFARYMIRELETQDIIEILRCHPEPMVAEWLISEIEEAAK